MKQVMRLATETSAGNGASGASCELGASVSAMVGGGAEPSDCTCEQRWQS